jgi:cobaltochelatase CobT
VEAAIERSTSATRGALRADADRLALRCRFHDAIVHARHRPEDALAGDLHDALELARLDVLGTRWLRGVAQNLLAHPGAQEDGPRWLAFEAMSGQTSPPVKAAAVARARAALSPALLDRLAALAAVMTQTEVFAAAASQWARDAARPLSALAEAAPGLVVDLPVGARVRQLPSRRDPGATPAALRKGSERRAFADEGNADGGAPVESATTGSADYHAFTTAFDRVVQAAALADREALAQLRVKLHDELLSLRSVIARLAKRLMRILMAQQTRRWQFDLDEGLLDGARLASVVTSRGHSRPFKQECEAPFPSTVVTLLIDHSGSMRGRPMQIAALTVEIFARVLERCGVKCEVLGFTTREWDGGEPGRRWAASGYPGNPGRLNALEHIVVKSADVPWRRARVGLGLFMRDDMLKENIDGEALEWAHARLIGRSERRRILVVVSDGTPMDEATLAANGHDYLDRHLANVVDRIETRSPIQLAAIGIGHDVSRFYRNATRIHRIDDLGPALTSKLIRLLAGDSFRSG